MGNYSKQELIHYVVCLGDDSLILGHRTSEWVSNGPFLEEDIALGNVALDYIGRSRMYYSYAAELSGHGKTEDDFAYLRNARDFQNYLINELPNRDFAFTITRQLILDVFNSYYLHALCGSVDKTLAAIAGKAFKETQYHLRRSKDWTLRLGDGTEQSHHRMQTAFDEIWGYTHELFATDVLEQDLIEAGIAVDVALIKPKWQVDIAAVLEAATLSAPTVDWVVQGGRAGYHTENLGHLLTEMQFLHRSLPGCQW